MLSTLLTFIFADAGCSGETPESWPGCRWRGRAPERTPLEPGVRGAGSREARQRRAGAEPPAGAREAGGGRRGRRTAHGGGGGWRAGKLRGSRVRGAPSRVRSRPASATCCESRRGGAGRCAGVLPTVRAQTARGRPGVTGAGQGTLGAREPDTCGTSRTLPAPRSALARAPATAPTAGDVPPAPQDSDSPSSR